MIAEVSDVANLQETRFLNEEVMRKFGKIFKEQGAEVILLSYESCAICENWAYCVNETCRHPEYMIPCIESQGILVTELAEKYGIPFMDSLTTIQWFGMILYKIN